MDEFAGKIVIVTGAASGIGLAAAQKFLEHGATVFGFDKNEEGLKAVKGLVPCVADMRDHDRLKAIVDDILKSHKTIHVLVNCAGMSYYTRHVDSTLEEWRTTLAINLEAYYVMAKLVVPGMIASGGGRIVNVSSTQSIASEPTVGAYSASKGGVGAWTRTLAVDLSQYGILVNAVAPGCIKTAMSFIDGVDETETDDFKEWYVKRRKIPLARPGRPEEVANAILFLSGDSCTYITGHTLVVDGGLTIAM